MLFLDHFMSHIYENPVEKEVDLVARILSLWENIHKPGNFEGVRDEHCASLQSLH
jgi:hypothetical protein